MNIFNYMNSAFCIRFAIALIHFLWQGFVIAALAIMISNIFGKKSSRTRYGIYVVSLLVMILSLVMTYFLIDIQSQKAERTQSSEIIPAEIDFREPVVISNQPRIAASEHTAMIETNSQTEIKNTPKKVGSSKDKFSFDWQSVTPYLISIYLLGVIVTACRLLLGLHGGQRLRKLSEPVTDKAILDSLSRQAKLIGLGFVPAISFCKRVLVPTVVGVFKPTILLPLSFANGLSVEQVEMLLAHELAHIRRYDPLVNIIQRIIETLLFFHPAVWYVSHKIRIEREYCCDDIVLQTGGKPVEYATCLVDIAQRTFSVISKKRMPVESMNAAKNPSKLGNRIRRLLGMPEKQQFRLRHTWLIAFVAIAILTVLAINMKKGGESQWGEAVDGVQIGIVDAKQITGWTDWQHPTIKLAVRVSNESEIIWVLPANDQCWQIEIDGIWYQYVVKSENSFHLSSSHYLGLANKSSLSDLSMEIAGHWLRIPEGKEQDYAYGRWSNSPKIEDAFKEQLVLMDGVHRIRVAIPLENPGMMRTQRLISNSAKVKIDRDKFIPRNRADLTPDELVALESERIFKEVEITLSGDSSIINWLEKTPWELVSVRQKDDVLRKLAECGDKYYTSEHEEVTLLKYLDPEYSFDRIAAHKDSNDPLTRENVAMCIPLDGKYKEAGIRIIVELLFDKDRGVRQGVVNIIHRRLNESEAIEFTLLYYFENIYEKKIVLKDEFSESSNDWVRKLAESKFRGVLVPWLQKIKDSGRDPIEIWKRYDPGKYDSWWEEATKDKENVIAEGKKIADELKQKYANELKFSNAVKLELKIAVPSNVMDEREVSKIIHAIEVLAAKGVPEGRDQEEYKWYEIDARLFDKKDDIVIHNYQGGEKLYTLLYNTDPYVISSDMDVSFKNVSVVKGIVSGSFDIQIEFDEKFSDFIYQFTSKNIDKNLAIVIDDIVVNVQRVMAPFKNICVIRGQMTQDEAENLSAILRKGIRATDTNNNEVSEENEVQINALIEKLQDKETSVQYSAIEALGNMGPEAQIAVPALIKKLKEREIFLCAPIARALWKIAPANEVVPALIETVAYYHGRDRIKEMDYDTYSSTNGAVMQVLAEMGDIAVPAIIEVLRNGDIGHSELLYYGIAYRDSADLNKLYIPVVRLLNDENDEVRIRAINALRDIDSKTDVPPELIRALKDDNPDIRKAAIGTIGRFGSRAGQTVPAIIDAAEKGDRDTLIDAMMTLSEIQSKEATQWLLNQFDNEDSLIVIHAVTASGQIGDSNAISKIAELLNRPLNPEQKYNIAPGFYNIPTAAHYALKRITENKDVEFITIDNEQKLQEIRAFWQAKLQVSVEDIKNVLVEGQVHDSNIVPAPNVISHEPLNLGELNSETQIRRDKEILSIQMLPNDNQKYIFGKEKTVTFIIRNISDKAIVVKGIDFLTNSSENTIRLTGSVYGSVSKLENLDAYHYNMMSQRPTKMSFYAGLLLPGQEITYQDEYQPVVMNESLDIIYVEANNKYDGTKESLMPFNPYIPEYVEGTMPNYYPFDEQKWLNLHRTYSLIECQVGPGTPKRAILLPDLNLKEKHLTVSIPVNYDGDIFALEAARNSANKISGLPIEDLNIVYSLALDGFVVREKIKSWILKDKNQSSKGALFNNCPLSFFKDIDTKENVRIRVGDKQEGLGPEEHPTERIFWDIYPVYYGDGMYTTGEFINVNKDNILSFLQNLTEKNQELKEHYYYFSSRYFDLVPGSVSSVLNPSVSAQSENNIPKIKVSSDWGEAINGLKCRLVLENTQWKDNEIPVLKLEVKNEGINPVYYLPFTETHCGIILDDYFYEMEEPVFTGDSPEELKPGQTAIFNIELNSKWFHNGDDDDIKYLNITSGKHKVWARFNPLYSFPGFNGLKSNKVYFDVIPSEDTVLMVNEEIKEETLSGYSVSGRVLTKPGGEGIAAEITLTNFSGFSKTIMSKEDGTFEFDNIQYSKYRYALELNQNIPGQWTNWIPVEVNDSDVENVNFFLTLPQSISGKVIDSETLEPVPNARINIRTRLVNNTHGIFTDGKGEFLIYANPQEITLTCRGTEDRYYPEEIEKVLNFRSRSQGENEVDEDESKSKFITLTIAEEAVKVEPNKNIENIIFNVHDAPKITGFVKYPDGKPAANIPVYFDADWTGIGGGGSLSGAGKMFKSQTDNEGKFISYARLSLAHREHSYRLEKLNIIPCLPDRTMGQTIVIRGNVIDKIKTPFEIELGESASVKLKIVDTDDNPIENAKVTASLKQAYLYPFLGGLVTYSGDGNYTMSGMIPGLDYHMIANAQGFTTIFGYNKKSFVLKPGEVYDAGRMVLLKSGESKDALPINLEKEANPDDIIKKLIESTGVIEK